MFHDRAHCPGGDCPQRSECLRYRAEVYGRQDFFGSPPYDRATQSCEHFIPLSSLMPTPEAIRTSAYHLWQREGCPEGRSVELWLRAERALVEAVLRDIAPESKRP